MYPYEEIMRFLRNVLALLFIFKLWSKSHRNFISHLRSRYGQNVIKTYRNYENTHKKLDKAQLDVKFLETCKLYNIIPKFLFFHSAEDAQGYMGETSGISVFSL